MNIQGQTIHIKNLLYKDDYSFEEYDRPDLMYKIFIACLIKDSLFHFFYEPDLIIRVFSTENLEKVELYLSENKYDFTTYDYPQPSKRLKEHCYGEKPNGIVMTYLDLFLPIFHINAISALKISEEEHFDYRKSVINSLIRVGDYSLKESVKHLQKLASFKLGGSSTNVSIQTFTPDQKNENSKSIGVTNEFSTVVQIIKIAKDKMTKDDYFLFMERVIHTMFNMGGCSRNEEGFALLESATKIQNQIKSQCIIL
jgi:hypothetical protein